MANQNTKQKWAIEATAVNQTGTTVTYLISVRHGDRIPKGAEIKFKVNGSDLVKPPVKLDEHGRATESFELNEEGKLKLEIRTVDPGGYLDVPEYVLDKSKVSAVDPIEVDLAIESNERGNGLYALAIGVFNKKGRGVAKTLRLVPPPGIQFQLDGEVVPKNGLPYHDVEVPNTGLLVVIARSLAPETEIDIHVLGVRKKEQLKLLSPRLGPIVATVRSSPKVHLFDGCEEYTVKENVVLSNPPTAEEHEKLEKLLDKRANKLFGRAFVAWLGLTIFMMGVFADHSGPFGTGWEEALLVMILVLAGLMALVALAIGIKPMNTFLVRPTMKTNTGLAWKLIGLTILLFVVMAYGGIGGNPLIDTEINRHNRFMERVESEDQERRRNRKEIGRSITDAERYGTPQEPITYSNSAPPDPVRDNFNSRFFWWMTLLVFSVLYFIVSLKDDLDDIVLVAKKAVFEKSEGSTGKSLSTAAIATVTAGPTGAIADFAKRAGEQVTWDIVLEVMKEIIKRGAQRVRR